MREAGHIPTVEEQIQSRLADESSTELIIRWYGRDGPPLLTVWDARRIIACLRKNRRFDTVEIHYYSLHDPTVLNVLRDGLRLCTSLTTVTLDEVNLSNEDLDRLRPAFSNTSITSLSLWENDRIQGQRGGEVLRDLLVGNDTLRELALSLIHFSPEVAIGFGQGLTDNHRLQVLRLLRCHIGNDGLANLLPADGMINNSLMTLYLTFSDIEGEDGGREVGLLLSRFPALKVLLLIYNDLGPLGARALAPGLAAASHLESLDLCSCGLGNDGVANLILPDGQVNRSLTNLDLNNNDIEGEDGGRQVCLLLQCFPTLQAFGLGYNNSLGPLGTRALAPGLAAARHLESLDLTTCRLGNDGVANLIPDGHVNRSLTKLVLDNNGIEGEDGGRQVSLLMLRCPVLKVLDLGNNDSLGPLGAHALAPGLAAASQLEELDLGHCGLENDSVANLIPDGHVNRSLTKLVLNDNYIDGEDGGRQVSLLMLRCPVLKVLDLSGNHRLVPLGAHALAPGLAAASQLEELDLGHCGLGNDSVANLIPDGQVNRSLTSLVLNGNYIEGAKGGENVAALVARCTNLNRLDVNENVLSPNQQRRVDMLLDQNRLCTEASALGGSTFPVLFRFVERAHCHEHGLSAIFVILQNDGDDYFCAALDRAID